MARQVIFVIGLVLAVAFNFVEGSLDQSNFAVNVVSDMDKFLNENPGVKAQPLIKQTRMAATPYAHLIYRIGGRVAGKLKNTTVVSICMNSSDGPNCIQVLTLVF